TCADTRLRLPGFRPAPIIVNYLGYPGTSGNVSTRPVYTLSLRVLFFLGLCPGLNSVDFVIVDTTTVPPEGDGASNINAGPGSCMPAELQSMVAADGVRAAFTEGLVYLPVTYQLNTYFAQQGSFPPTSHVFTGFKLKKYHLCVCYSVLL